MDDVRPTPSLDYPGAAWILADPSNYSPRLRQLAAVDRIVIHITDGHANPRGTAGMFATPKAKRDPPIASSAHFIVGQDGTIIQCVPLCFAAYHAHAANDRSIAIEHCARTPGEWGKTDAGLLITDVQYRSSAQLAAFLCNLIAQPRNRTTIQGHIEIDPETTHKDCPNSIWDWNRYTLLLGGTTT